MQSKMYHGAFFTYKLADIDKLDNSLLVKVGKQELSYIATENEI